LGAIVLGEALKKDINRHIHDDRIFVLPNCIPDSDFLKNQYEILPNSNRKKNFQILYLSNLVRSKGALEFLKMARLVIRRYQNVRFILAGAKSPDNEFLIEIKNYIEKHSISKFVNLFGAIYGKDKEKIFQESDIFVFPTFFELEALPLVNLEAMRAGLPVISSYEGCIPETIINGHNGYTENPKNIQALSRRVIELVNNDKLRTQMGSAGRKLYVQKYTPDIYRLNLGRAVNFFFDLRSRPI
jgi:glycosyltransferase involved in cell wall biosynthesis